MFGTHKSAYLTPDTLARLTIAAMCLITVVAHAADPQPYNVNLDKTGNAELDQLLRDASTLISLRQNAEVGPFALITRSKQDQERFNAALHSLGYYKGNVSIRIADRMLDDPELIDWLTDVPADPPVTATNDGSPPYASMFSRTQASARLRSMRCSGHATLGESR